MIKTENLLGDKAFLKRAMEKLLIVRKFETKVFELYNEGKIYGTTHLGIGEEATSVGTSLALKDGDYVVGTHRGHGQSISRGVNVKAAMAEMLGRETGACRGFGGSMHIADISRGVIAACGIVGGGLPIATGAALAIKMKRVPDSIVAVYFGDGAMNEGAVHEAMNLASVWRLPIMFVLTDNGYGMSTPKDRVMRDIDLAKRATPYGIKTFEVDGNDVLAVYAAALEAREYIFANGEPVMVVEHTYRTSGHSKSDNNAYRSQEEIDGWLAVNPVARFTKVLLENGFTEADITEMNEQADKEIDEAVAFAQSSPFPDPDKTEKVVFAGCGG